MAIVYFLLMDKPRIHEIWTLSLISPWISTSIDPQTKEILTNVSFIFCPNLEVLASIGVENLHGETQNELKLDFLKFNETLKPNVNWPPKQKGP